MGYDLPPPLKQYSWGPPILLTMYKVASGSAAMQGYAQTNAVIVFKVGKWQETDKDQGRGNIYFILLFCLFWEQRCHSRVTNK